MWCVRLVLVTLLLALAACGHPPDTRSVQEAVDDAVAGR